MIHPNSRAAYDELDLSKRQAGIYKVFKLHQKPMTDRVVLYARTGLFRGDMNAVRPRITELIQKGLLEEKGKTKDGITGRTVRLVGLIESQTWLKFQGDLETPEERREYMEDDYPNG